MSIAEIVSVDNYAGNATGRSTTWLVTARTIVSQPELESVMIRLMMSVNDLSLVNHTIGEWSESEESTKGPRKLSAQLYFVRILLSHVFEALAIIKEISGTPTLRAAVDRCDAHTISAFLAVEAFAASKEIESLHDLRNRASFHYDKQWPAKCLREIADIDPYRPWSYQMGTESLDWHFELADAVVDRIMVREVYRQKGPRGPERREKLRSIALREQEIARAFSDFAAHFVRHYSK